MGARTHSVARVPGPVRWFVGVAAREQTYRNLAYLGLTFPLGLAYFALLTTGLSVGFSLLAVLVGVPILVGSVVLSDRILVFERWLAVKLLRTDLPLARDQDPEDAWDYLRSPLSDLGTWIGVFYLWSKFVVGLFTFVVLVVLAAVAGSFLLAPLYYQHRTVQVSVPEPIHLSVSYVVQRWGGVEVISYPVTITSWEVSTLPEALALAGVGAVLLIASLHLCNLLAKIQSWYTRLLIRPRPLA